MARTVKSEAQRATEALEVAQRKVERLTAERARLDGELNAVSIQLEAARKIRDYRAAHPALPQEGDDGERAADS